MIVLKAKSNATIEYVNNHFPLGQRTSALIQIEDEALKEQLSLIYTGDCEDKYNYFPYGDFEDCCEATENIVSELNPDCIVDIVSGEGFNYSNTLMLYAPKNKSLGELKIKSTKDTLTIGDKYTFSCKVKLISGSLSFNFGDQNIDVLSESKDWITVRQEFIATENTSGILNVNFASGKCYLDGIKLFKSVHEITNSDAEFDIEIKILNPCNYDTKINKIVSWYNSSCICCDNKDNESDLSVLLDVPPITVVDFADNLLCRFIINRKLPKRVSYLDNIIYNETNTTIYESQDFILCGYIIPKAKPVTKVSLVSG